MIYQVKQDTEIVQENGEVQCFATDILDMDLDHIIAKYKFMVQDECRIKTKSKDIRVRSSSSPMNS